MALLKLSRKAGANKEERGSEYHKGESIGSHGPHVPHGLVRSQTLFYVTKHVTNFSRPNPVQYHYATCSSPLILPSLHHRSKWTKRYTHTRTVQSSLSNSIIINVDFLSPFSRDSQSHTLLTPSTDSTQQRFFSLLSQIPLFLFSNLYIHHFWFFASQFFRWLWMNLTYANDFRRAVIKCGSGKMSQSIFHQTVLCQTQTVAEHQSKVSSLEVSANKGKKNLFLAPTNFRGSRLCVRKRKLTMGRHHHRHVDAVPRAVLTTNLASEVCMIIITSFQSNHYYNYNCKYYWEWLIYSESYFLSPSFIFLNLTI